MSADRIFVTLGGTVGNADAKVPLEIIQGAHGKSAYELAVKNGFVGTEKEWLDSLKEPAVEAANVAKDRIDKIESDFTKSENLRQSAEEERQKSELIREGAEDERSTAEHKRQTNEEARQEAELLRTRAYLEAEKHRNDLYDSAEAERQSSFNDKENDREEAFNTNEQKRIDAENIRISNENERNASEDERISSENERRLAERQRESNESERQESESNRIFNEESRGEIFSTLKTDSETATKRANDAAVDVESNMGAIRQDLADAKQSSYNSAASAEQSAQSASNAQAVSEDAKSKAETAISIARGKATGYVFDTKADMDAWLSVAGNKALLNLGDNLYIRDVNVSDYWWDGTSAQKLETEHPDLTHYVKDTDYATNSKVGVVKANGSVYGVSVNWQNGDLYINAATQAELLARTNYYKPLVAKEIDYAVKVGVTTNTIKLTDAEIAAAKQWLGIFEWEGSLEDYLALESIDPNVTYHILES